MVIPLMTMRSFSEEKKSGTFELLVTYPISDWEIVLGKFLAASFSVLILTGFIVLHALLAVSVGGKVEWLQLVWGFVGLSLVGLSFVAVGIFASSLTENQIVAAMLSFGFLLLFWVVGWMSDLTGGSVASVLKQVSLLTHADPFYKGLIDIKDFLFYVLFILFFIFSTLRVMEVRKWRR
jgi:ABC-2 type transport system permease protein